MLVSNGPKLAALAVVLRDDEVLLVKRRNEPDAGLWGYPGGHVDLGETALEAAARELQEETGVIARPLSYLTNIDAIQWGNEGAVEFHFLLAAVLCAFEVGEPAADDDVMDARWWPIKEVLAGAVSCSADVDTVLELAVLGERT